jgi:pimeloyl-ACP methyl ester carboxylesterase
MMREQRTALRGRVTRYLEAGVGEPLILLHPFPLSADVWRPQLQATPRHWRYIAPDLRGLGGSALGGSSEIGMNDYATDVLDLMTSLDIDRAAIAGLSMGGYVAFALLRMAPDRIRGLVLADTRPQADSEDGVRNRRATLELVRTEGLAALGEQMIGKLVGETTRRDRPQVAAEVRRMIEAQPPEGIEAAVYAMMRRPDSTPDLAAIRCPTLVIVGEEDTLTPPADAEAMHRAIAGSRFRRLAGAGHLSNLEAQAEFSTTINGWVESLPSSLY